MTVEVLSYARLTSTVEVLSYARLTSTVEVLSYARLTRLLTGALPAQAQAVRVLLLVVHRGRLHPLDGMYLCLSARVCVHVGMYGCKHGRVLVLGAMNT